MPYRVTVMHFVEKLRKAWKDRNSLLCVGLDPVLERLPAHLQREEKPFLAFNRAIIEATKDLVCAYKPQFAHYAGQAREDELRATLAYLRDRCPNIPVILDAKRGDIGSTAELYAREAFDIYGADAVTVNPYMGGDTLKPFLAYKERGVIILCRTSNPGSGDFQNLEFEGKKLYEIVAEKAAKEWNEHGNACLVVGATWPEELGRIREIVGDMPLLVPGVGAQGGDAQAVIQKGADVNGTGLMVNASRGVIYAGSGANFAEKARQAAGELRDTLNGFRG